MEELSKLLILDVNGVLTELFRDTERATECPAHNSQPVECLSYTVRHKYPQRLITYDAEELCEPRLMRYSDLTHSLLDIMKPVCQRQQAPPDVETQPTAKDKCRSAEKTKEFIRKCSKVLTPKDNLTEQRLAELEQSSQALHAASLERQCGGAEPATKSTWANLQPVQKFCFYWQSLTGHQLRPTPYNNFKEIFGKRAKQDCPDITEERLRLLMRHTWRCMKSKERVPFNMHALLYHVSTGAVDPFDHCALRVLLNRWR